MQTVWITGGAGFIGSNLCQSLLQKNHRVVCIDNLLTGSEENIAPFKNNINFTYVNQDVIDFTPEKAKKIEKPDFIFHLASPASPNKKSAASYMAYPIETLLVNSKGTFNMLELAKESSARFLLASTSEIYGDPTVSPQPETYNGNVNPLGVRSVYDEAKRFAETLTMSFVRKYGLDGRIVRIFNTYGPRLKADDGRVVSNLLNAALKNEPLTIYGDGSQTRSFCYISDMVEGLQKAMFLDGLKGEAINLGNPDEKKIIEFATLIKKLIETKSEIIFEKLPEDDPKQRKPDISKARKLLKWEPKVSLAEGLKKTIEYYKKQ